MKTNTSNNRRQEKECERQETLVKKANATKETGKEGADGNC